MILSKVNFKKLLNSGLSALASLLLTAAPAAAQSQPTILKYFGGSITAKLSWLVEPTTVKNEARLKVDFFDSKNNPYQIDPTLIGAGLFMPSMPDMGVMELDVVLSLDAGGQPIPASISMNHIKFSMRGGWEVLLTLPNPSDANKTETQKLNLLVF